MQLVQRWPFVSYPEAFGSLHNETNLLGFHGADSLFLHEICFQFAPHEFSIDNWQVEIDIMGNDRRRLLHIGIELREHFMQRHAFAFARSVVIPCFFTESKGIVKSVG